MTKFILFLSFIMASVCYSYAYDIVEGDFSFNILSEDDATVVLAKAEPPSKTSEMIIPATVYHNGKSYTVTKIGERAINSISIYNFSIFIPNTIQEIEDYGISSCYHLYLIEFEKGETPITIGRGVLNSCGDLEQAIIYRQFIYNENVTIKPFAGKKKLDSVFLGGSWHNISEREFAGCPELIYISLHSDIHSIGAYAFQNCPKFSKFVDGGYYDQGYDYMERLSEIGEYAFSETAMSHFVFSENITHIPNRLFYKCSSLKNVYFPDSCKIEEIGVGAFMDCTALESIIIPKSIKTIYDISFTGCSSLKTFTIQEGKDLLTFVNGNYTSENFQDTPIKELYIGRNFTGDPFDENTALESVTFGNEVLELPLYSFKNCSSLKNINWGARIENISSYSFENCVSLESIILPDSLKRLGTKVFSGCTNLKSISLNEGLQYIYSSCFSGTSISSINIPSTVEIVDEYAFASCFNLMDVVFSGKEDSPELKCARYSFQNAPVTHFYIDRLLVTPYNSSGRYYDNLFTDNSIFKSVKFGPNAKTIGSYTFYNCTSVEKIEISEGIKTIASFAFYKTSNLKSIEFPSTLEEIGNINFNDCSNLTTLSFADSEKPIKLGHSNSSYNKQGEGLFYTCPITTVYIGRNLEYDSTLETGFSPFYGIKTLNKVILSDNVSQIPTSLFQECKGLDSLTIPSEIKSISNYAFNGCSNLKHVSFGEGLENIEAYAFMKCPISTISCSATVAPYITDKNPVFEDSIFNNAILKIPNGTITSYNTANVWEKFFYISEIDRNNIFIHSIILNKDSISLIPGLSEKIELTYTPLEATNKTFRWETSDSSVAIVDSMGVICGLSSGVAEIAVSSDDGSEIIAKCIVTVKSVVTNIILPDSCLTLNVGDSTFLDIIVLPENAENKELEWTSSNENVAIVAQDGLIKALSAGQTIITAKSTDGTNISDYCIVEITDNTGISNIRGNTLLNIIAEDNTIKITGAHNTSEVMIFNLNGIQVYRGKDRAIRGMSSGIYFVHVEGKTFKVAL